MKTRLVLAAAAATLCFPACAVAASSAGVVLSVDGHRHALQFVSARHVVHAYRFRGRLPGVGVGSRVRIRLSGQRIKRLAMKPGRARTVSFFARVVHVGAHSVVLRLGDRKLMRLAASAVPATSPRYRRLVPGVVVLVTETLGNHRSGAKSINLKPIGSTSGSGTPGAGGSPQQPGGTPQPGSPLQPGALLQASGTVVELDQTGLVLQTSDGSMLRFAVAASMQATLRSTLCDTVTVSYHRFGATYVADDVESDDSLPLGACANVGDGSESGATGQTAIGTVTQLTLTSLTVTTAGGGSASFNATLDLTSGFVLGDQLDITYTQSGAVLVAGDLAYYDQDAIGTVTSIDAGSVTIELSGTTAVQTFTDDPMNATFDGISVGDQIDVTYHLSSGQPAVDSVNDLTNPQ
jgi:hypothetical protein